MDEVLRRIKRAVLAGNYRLTLKAQIEMYSDDLDESDIRESILCAKRIHKTIRTNAAGHRRAREYLHIIVCEDLSGTAIYTKGKLVREFDVDVYYVFVSAKLAV